MYDARAQSSRQPRHVGLHRVYRRLHRRADAERVSNRLCPSDPAAHRAELPRVPQPGQAEGRPLAGDLRRHPRRRPQRRHRQARQQRAEHVDRSPHRPARSADAEGRGPTQPHADRPLPHVDRSRRALDPILAARAAAVGGAPRPDATGVADSRLAVVDDAHRRDSVAISRAARQGGAGGRSGRAVRASCLPRRLGTAAHAGGTGRFRQRQGFG